MIPSQSAGRLVLDRNPDNFFAEIEQAAFSPGTFVPGVEASPDKLLQGRLVSYPDTQRHRLGRNYALIPLNAPRGPRVINYQRDGYMRVDDNGGARELRAERPRRSLGRPRRARGARAARGQDGAHGVPEGGRTDDFEQAGMLYRVLKHDERARLVANIAGHLGGAGVEIQRRQVAHFAKADAEYGARVARALELASD